MIRRSRIHGQALLETVLLLPFLLLFLIGTIELGKIVYTYFALQKALYSIARMAGTQQGINLCDSTDALLTLIILKVVDITIGLRVTSDEEMEGLDLTQHGESLG